MNTKFNLSKDLKVKKNLKFAIQINYHEHKKQFLEFTAIFSCYGSWILNPVNFSELSE